jgi:hypothetical protein
MMAASGCKWLQVVASGYKIRKSGSNLVSGSIAGVSGEISMQGCRRHRGCRGNEQTGEWQQKQVDDRSKEEHFVVSGEKTERVR